METRVDLHVHSRHSDRPSEWILRRLGAPESFTSPREIYERCHERGMTFVTITDHDTIDGALEIGDLPGTFVSSEMTVRFPEDGCPIHCLVYGIDEKEHDELLRRAEDVYAFADHVHREGIAHAVAHPLYGPGGELTPNHFERLLLLFSGFEGLNGTRDPRAGILTRAVLSNLSPKLIDELAHIHDLEPRGETPWRKHMTAGSDDHAGVSIATSWTQAPAADDPAAFLAHLRAGRSRLAGETGSSLKLGRSLLAIALDYHRRRVAAPPDAAADPIGVLLSSLIDGESPGSGVFMRVASTTLTKIGDTEQRGPIARAAAEIVQAEPSSVASDERRTFEMTTRASDALVRAGTEALETALPAFRLGEAVDALGSMAAGAAAASPYLAAFHSQHRDERLLERVASRFPAGNLLRRRGSGRAWFTDVVDPSDPAMAPVLACSRHLGARSEALTLITCTDEPPEIPVSTRNFDPLLRVPVEGWRHQSLTVPSLLPVIEFCERRGVHEIVLSTPGPLGIVASLTARLLCLRLTVIHQIDLPALVAAVSNSRNVSRTAWRLLAWLYAPARRIFVLDDGVTAELRAQGFDRNKITSLPRLAARPSRESPDSRQDSSGRYDWSVLVDAIWRQDPPLERSSDRPGVSTVTDDWPAVVADVS